tara:strand:+ start:9719 stop:9925 length:207 start_codon:yes stop_codon:yes gene_type:complete
MARAAARLELLNGCETTGWPYAVQGKGLFVFEALACRICEARRIAAASAAISAGQAAGSARIRRRQAP